MFGIQELFDKQTEEHFQPARLAAKILEAKLEEIGIFLTEIQRRNIEERLLNLDSEFLTFDFTDEQIQSAGFSCEKELEPKIRKIIDDLPRMLDKFLSTIDETMENILKGVTDSAADSILKSLEKSMHEMLERQESFYHEIATNIESIWGEALSLLQGLIVISDESSLWYAERVDEYMQDDTAEDLLLRIHAKAVQVAKEILTLLRNGYPDGAQARWRTLHELSVIGLFISEQGDETAERYINHEAIGQYKAAIQHNEYFTRLGMQPIPEDEMKFLKEGYLKLIEKYGASYKYEYGWAANAINSKKPTFREIESSIDLDHHRPYYNTASANIHGNSSGIFQSLALSPEEDMALSGPSNIGLAQPALSTVISLILITTTMLTHGANVDCIAISKIIDKFGRKVEDAFIAVETDISSQIEA